MEMLASALGILAGIVQLAGYWQYHLAMTKAGHKANVASWFMWGVGGLTELIVYAALVDDRSKEFLPAVCAVVVVITFGRIWWRNKSLHLTLKEWGVVAIDAGVVGFWFLTKNPFASNALLGLDMILSFTPILLEVSKEPGSEDPEPWKTWSLAYFLLTLVVLLKWVSWWELIYPLVYLALHSAVWHICKKGSNAATNH